MGRKGEKRKRSEGWRTLGEEKGSWATADMAGREPHVIKKEWPVKARRKKVHFQQGSHR